MIKNIFFSALLGMLGWSLLLVSYCAIHGSPVAAQAPEECTSELVADYEAREWLIFDLMMEVQECRIRFGGCRPGEHWLLDEQERQWHAAHPYHPLTEHDLEAWTREVESDPAVGPER